MSIANNGEPKSIIKIVGSLSKSYPTLCALDLKQRLNSHVHLSSYLPALMPEIYKALKGGLNTY